MLAQAWELFRNQGPVFWGAAVAVALGATLLLTTVVAYLRQAWRRRAPLRRLRRAAAGGRGTLIVDDGGYRFRPGAAAAAPAPPAVDPQGQLLARLRAAADRLQECQDSLACGPGQGWDSRLKEGPAAVDYVFRKGIG